MNTDEAVVDAIPKKRPMKATDILRDAAHTIFQRAEERDLPEERSMKRAVAAFNALTGNSLPETQGWLFVAILKLSRATAGAFQPDDLKDCAAYVALALECEMEQDAFLRKPKPGEWVEIEGGER